MSRGAPDSEQKLDKKKTSKNEGRKMMSLLLGGENSKKKRPSLKEHLNGQKEKMEISIDWIREPAWRALGQWKKKLTLPYDHPWTDCYLVKVTMGGGKGK